MHNPVRAQSRRLQSIYVFLAAVFAKVTAVLTGLDHLTTTSWSRLTIAAACAVALVSAALWVAGLRGLVDHDDRVPFISLWRSSRFAWTAACALWGAGLGLGVFYVVGSTLSVVSQYAPGHTTVIGASVTSIDRNPSPRSPCQVRAQMLLEDGRNLQTCLVGKWTRTAITDVTLQPGSRITVAIRDTSFGTAIESIELSSETAS